MCRRKQRANRERRSRPGRMPKLSTYPLNQKRKSVVRFEKTIHEITRKGTKRFRSIRDRSCVFAFYVPSKSYRAEVRKHITSIDYADFRDWFFGLTHRC